MEKFDLYWYEEKLKRTLGNLESDKKICKEDKKNIISFSKIRLAKGSSAGRVAKVGVRFMKRIAAKYPGLGAKGINTFYQKTKFKIP